MSEAIEQLVRNEQQRAETVRGAEGAAGQIIAVLAFDGEDGLAEMDVDKLATLTTELKIKRAAIRRLRTQRRNLAALATGEDR